VLKQSGSASAARLKIRDASAEMGVIGLRDYITGRFGSNGTVLCCPNLPTSGGAARNVFDEIVEIVIRDGSGNPIGTRLFIGEGKGYAEWFSVLSKAQGRLVTLQDGREVYALQGTREYIEGTALKMSASSDPSVSLAGQKVLDKIALNLWDEIEYAFVASRWITQGKRVQGMSPVMQITRVSLLQ
jgi:hypothetical protein